MEGGSRGTTVGLKLLGRLGSESVCLQLLPRKTRPERRWDLISALEAWQETGSSGVKGGVKHQKWKEDSHPS